MPMICNGCGESNSGSAITCVTCGVPLTDGPQPQSTPPSISPHTTVPPTPAPLFPLPQQRPALTYVRLWPRFVAMLIDGILSYAVCIPFALIVGGPQAVRQMMMGETTDSATNFLLLTVFPLVLYTIYQVWMERSALQATLGKMALKIKVSDAEGNRAPLSAIIVRYLVYSGIVSVLYTIAQFTAYATFIGNVAMLYYIILAITIAVDRTHQGLHNRAARTYVIRN